MDPTSIPYLLRELANEVEQIKQPTVDYGRKQQAEAWSAVHRELTRHNSYSRATAAQMTGLDCALATIKYLQDRSDLVDDIENLL